MDIYEGKETLDGFDSVVVMNSPKDHDFDWVKALGDCSVYSEFEELKRDVRSNTKQRNSDYPRNPEKWKIHEGSGTIRVIAMGHHSTRPGKPRVVFNIEHEYILVTGFKHNDPLRLTLTLDDDGVCLFQINGEGQYKRWQVNRRALEPLFFRLDDIDSTA